MNEYIKDSTGTDFFLVSADRPTTLQIYVSVDDGSTYELVKTYNPFYSKLIQMNLKEGIKIKFTSDRELTINNK